MKKKIIGIFVCMLLLVLIIPVGIQANLRYDPLDGGWVEEIDGVTILHISGTNYEMGYQNGYLLKDKIYEVYRAVLTLAEPGYVEKLLNLWNTSLKQFTPEEYLVEMQGVADGSGLTFEDIVILNKFYVFFSMGCTDMAAWGPATLNGELIHLHSLDWYVMKDPVSGHYVDDNQIMCVRNPDNGFASIYISFAGGVFAPQGFNEKNIAVSEDTSGTIDFTWNGTDVDVRFLQVLDHAATATDAINIMTNNTNGGVNYIISDGNIPIAYVVEETANFTYIGTWDDPVESTSPFWSIDHVVRRRNFFIHPDAAKTQRYVYDLRFSTAPWKIFSSDEFFYVWRCYRALSMEVGKLWGALELNNTLTMLRSIYRGNTDWYLTWFNFLMTVYTLQHTLQYEIISYNQWAVCPKTGDIAISFAEGETSAEYTTIHYFNFYNLLKSGPSI